MSVTSKKAKQRQVIIMLVAASSYSNTHPLLILVVSKIVLHSFPSLPTACQFLIVFQSSSTSSLLSLSLFLPSCMAYSLDVAITICFGTFSLFILSICPHCLNLSDCLNFTSSCFNIFCTSKFIHILQLSSPLMGP